jgi:cellulose synthase/poly-beta-1,6-N-acetylglucosamine synthase-like glycosyltransferase
MTLTPLLMLLNAAAIATAYSFVISLKLYNRLYRRRAHRRYAHNYQPTKSIFVPCKGANEGFADNVRTILRLVDPHTTLFFIVESRDDPAFPVLKRLSQDTIHAYVVVAG